MAGMHPEEFFRTFVKENLAAWEQERSSIARACNLAVAAASLADHYYRFHRYAGVPKAEMPQRDPGLKAFQTGLAQRAPEFRTIQAVANAYKHLYTWKDWSVASTGALECIILSDATIEERYASDSEGADDVAIKHRDGSQSLFSTSIGAVISMWREILNAPPPVFK